MKRQNILLATTAVAVVGMGVWFGLVRGLYFGRRLLAMPIGTDRTVAVGALGEPDEVRSTFRLAQHRLYEREYEEAAVSTAVEFLVWEFMIDTVCCAGFDTQGKLVVRACGTS